MAYAPYNSTSPNPFRLAGDQPIAGHRVWQYVSTHTQAVVGTSDFWSDGYALGAKVGDLAFAIPSTGAASSIHRVTVVASTYTSLSTGATIG